MFQKNGRRLNQTNIQKSPLDGIPIHLPALLHAEKTQKESPK